MGVSPTRRVIRLSTHYNQLESQVVTDEGKAELDIAVTRHRIQIRAAARAVIKKISNPRLRKLYVETMRSYRAIAAQLRATVRKMTPGASP